MSHKGAHAAVAVLLSALALTARSSVPGHYGVLPALVDANLAVYLVEGDVSNDTSEFLTLDEGLSGREVKVAEISVSDGFTYRLPPLPDRGVWRERPFEPPRIRSLVNQVHVANLSDRPLLLLSGEIVVGGKQDRVIAQDRIIAPDSSADIEVFCVEPHRWTGSSGFRIAPVIAQPSVRDRVLEGASQNEVWDSVRVARDLFAKTTLPADATEWASSSSYAAALQDPGVRTRVDQIVETLTVQYERLRSRIPHPHIQGAAVAVNGELVWADNFASPRLFDRYWSKLARSYAAEALAPRVANVQARTLPSIEAVMRFFTDLSGRAVGTDAEPGLYRLTHIYGSDFHVSILTSQIPGLAFDVHRSKSALHFDR